MDLTPLIGILAGIVAAFGFNRYVGARPKRAREFWILGLIVATLIYVVLAVVNGESTEAVLIESVGVLVFGAFILLSVVHHSWWLALGWLLHPVWDIALHHPMGDFTHAPEWYVWACLAFDLVVGVTIWRVSKNAARFDVQQSAE